MPAYKFIPLLISVFCLSFALTNIFSQPPNFKDRDALEELIVKSLRGPIYEDGK